MKICKNCGSRNDLNAVNCTVCKNTTFSYEAENYNSNTDRKNIIIGVLAGVAITAIAALCIFAFSDKDKDNNKNKNSRYDYSYYEEYEDVDENEESEEENTDGTDEYIIFSHPSEDESYTDAQEFKDSEEIYENEPDTQVFAPEPGNIKDKEMKISDDLRYSLNLFVSNFSEARMESFDQRPSDDELIKFAMNYNLINKSERFENGEWSVNGQVHNKRISEDYVYESLENHFTCSIGRTEGKNTPRYSDGYFYTTFTGGLIENDVSIVNYLEYVGDDTYYVRFNMYFNGGDNSECYRLDDSQMAARGSYSGNGYAYISASDIYNYDTYYLESYSVS